MSGQLRAFPVRPFFAMHIRPARSRSSPLTSSRAAAATPTGVAGETLGVCKTAVSTFCQSGKVQFRASAAKIIDSAGQ
jgi:hypothetical protein